MWCTLISALLFGDCTPVYRVERYRCKSSGTRLLVDTTEKQGMWFTLIKVAVHRSLGTAHLYAEWIFVITNAMAQGCSQTKEIVVHVVTSKAAHNFGFSAFAKSFQWVLYSVAKQNTTHRTRLHSLQIAVSALGVTNKADFRFGLKSSPTAVSLQKPVNLSVMKREPKFAT